MSRTLDVMKAIGIPYAYDHFAEGESPDPPFAVYRYPATDNFMADGIVFFPVNEVNIELYTDEKDPKIEKRIEAALKDQGIAFEKEETWIAEERLYEVIYDFDEPDYPVDEEQEVSMTHEQEKE